jgi:hemolysin D
MAFTPISCGKRRWGEAMTNPIPLHPPHGQAEQAQRPLETSPKADGAEMRKDGGESPVKVVTAIFRGGAAGAARAIRMTSNEREFLPAALEIVETPASPTLRATALTLCGLVAAAIIWSCLAHIDMVAVAPGKVVPLGQIKVIQPLETSAIHAIHVDDGDHVAAGQILVELDPTDVKADLASLIYDRGQAALDAEAARLLMTRDPNAPFTAPDGVEEPLAEANHAQAIAEIRKHLAQVEGIEAELTQKQAALEANAATIARARDTLPLLDEKNAMAKTLYEKQAGARPPVLDSAQAMIEKRAELKSAEAATKQIGGEMAATKAKLDEIEAGFLAEAGDRRTKALQKMRELDQQIAKSRQRESYRRLVAPVDGTVQNVKIHTPGAVVTTADTLMDIVPDGAGIEVEANVENKDIGFVREGQAVEVKFDAFPFTRYGLVKGTVKKLGRDAAPASAPQAGVTKGSSTQTQAVAQAANGELAYLAKITLAQDWIAVADQRERLQPGMRVSAEIKTGDRKVIEYILSPVVQVVSEAGRER